MDAKQKQIQQGYIQSNLTGLGAVISKLVKERDEHAEQLTALTMNGSQQFTAEYIEREQMRLKAAFAVKMSEVYKDIEARLDNLYKLLAARDETLDMSNPAFGAALTLIQTANGEPSHEQARAIHANFKHDQQALKALRDVYKGKDIGGISGMIYDLDEVIGGLKELANNCTVKEGSVNYFASRLAKLAAIEGVDMVANPDERGTMEAMRRGAGLK